MNNLKVNYIDETKVEVEYGNCTIVLLIEDLIKNARANLGAYDLPYVLGWELRNEGLITPEILKEKIEAVQYV